MGNTKVVVTEEAAASKVAKITAIKQDKAASLSATFSADMTGIKDTDLKIVRDETGAVVTVKSVAVDKKDNTKVSIETYEALTDGKAYTVTYTATDEAKTTSSATFTATAGVVADIALNTYTIPANTPTEVKYQTLDANGVIIAEAGIGSSAANNMEISVENPNGYQNNNDLLLYKAGDTATVKVVFHTYKYNNTNGTEEGKVEKSFTITAVDQSTVIETFDYTVTNYGSAVDFKRDKLIQQLALDDDKASNPYAYFSFRTAAGKDITSSLDYTVSSGNENVLLANGTVAGGAQLTPVGVGATYLVIKNASGTVVTTLPINVVAKRSLSTMTVDKSSVTVSESMTDTSGSQKITIAVMDQYSEPYTKFSAGNLELKTNKAPGGLNVSVGAPANNKVTITIDTASGTANVGTYSYTVDLTDTENANNVKKVSFSVTVAKQLSTSNTSYALVMMNSTQDTVITKVDTTVTADTYSATTLKPTIVTKNNGSITGKAGSEIVSMGALKLTKNGAGVDNSANIYAPTASAALSAAQVKVTEKNGAGVIKKNLSAGTYTVSFKASIDTNSDGTADKVQDMSTSFVVEDSQKVFEASVKKESVAAGKSTLQDVFEDPDYVSFAYAGHELAKADYNYTYADANYTRINANMIRVNKVTMNVTLPGTNNQIVQMTADVNRTFTFGTAIATKANVDANITAFKKAYADTNGTALKANMTTTDLENAVSNALAVKNAYSTLSAADQDAVEDAKDNIVTLGKDAALLIVKNIATSGSALNLDTFTMLEVTSAKGANIPAYKQVMTGATFTGLTSAGTAKNVLQTMVDEINTLSDVQVSVGADGKIALANTTGLTYTTYGLLDSDVTTDTAYTAPLTIKDGITAGKLTIKKATYTVSYTFKDADSTTGVKAEQDGTATYNTAS